MQTNSFKTYQRRPRSITVEENYAGGMQYTDTPLPEGFAKTLLNYEFKDSGKTITPRGGLRSIEAAVTDLGEAPHALQCHHIGQGRVAYNTFEDAVHKYILLFQDDPEKPYFDLATATILLEREVNNGVPNLISIPIITEEAAEYRILGKRYDQLKRMHGMDYVGQSNEAIYTILNNTTYMPAQWKLDPEDEEFTSGLVKLTFERLEDEITYQAKIERVTAKEISPTEAINYGYNMLSNTPYTFSDRISAAVPANYIILDGVLPYRDATCTELMFNANVGSWVTFRLYAQFPDTVSTYKFRWEIRDLESDAMTVYENQETELSKTYHYDEELGSAVDNEGNQFIILTFQPPFRQFSVVVTAYSTNDLTEPIQVMPLAAYSLIGDKAGSTNSIEVKNYRLDSTDSMTTWAHRLVLWGVRSAKNILFVSDINDPSYFPYPNNAHIFEEDIIACVPYLSDLLVFTESRLYHLVWAEDGMSYTSDIIQDNLMLSPADYATITTVKNMVFFKNGNYYYMVVPNNNGQAWALQLAPISTPITYLLDDFKRELTDIFMTVYNPDRFHTLMTGQDFDLQLIDYHNYLDITAMRNVYKLSLNILDAEGTIMSTVCTFDFILSYDTMLRTWSASIVESNPTRMLPYRQTVTDTTVLTNLVCIPALYTEGEEGPEINGFVNTLELIQSNPLVKKDLFGLVVGVLPTGRRLKNWQYLDTGYREHATQMKKRYREIQFKINNISQESLQFGTEFIIDDITRRELFTYTVKQVTDDPNDPDYGYLYVEREFAEPQTAYGATILENAENPKVPEVLTRLSTGDVLYSNRWVLDLSRLSKVSSVKIRFPVSGKGYAPRLKILSFNEEAYEFLSYSWVYRGMNAR
jgi:hypothetical protein